jgi:hypothetical protein
MDEGVRPFENFRWSLEILHLAHPDSDQFCSYGIAQEALPSRNLDGTERKW